MLLYKEQYSAQIFYYIVSPQCYILGSACTQNKDGLLIEMHFLLVLFLNLKYRCIRTNTDKYKFANALYILKCNYFPDSFFNTWSMQSQDLRKLFGF